MDRNYKFNKTELVEESLRDRCKQTIQALLQTRRGNPHCNSAGSPEALRLQHKAGISPLLPQGRTAQPLPCTESPATRQKELGPSAQPQRRQLPLGTAGCSAAGRDAFLLGAARAAV